MQNLLKAYTRQTSQRGNDSNDEAVRKYAPMVYRVVRQVAGRMPASVDREYLFSAGMAIHSATSSARTELPPITFRARLLFGAS